MENNNQQVLQTPIEDLYEEYQRSGMTRREFCNSKGLSYQNFRSKITRMKKGKSGELVRLKSQKEFIEVRNPFDFHHNTSESKNSKWFTLQLNIGIFKLYIKLEDGNDF